jgi:tetratricopeptide (TPR) repeat protein
MIWAPAALALLLAAPGVDSTEADRMYAAQRYAEAAAAYRALLEEDPDNPALRLRLGASLLQLGRPDEALPPLEAAEKTVPGDAAILQVLGQAYLAAGRFAEAAARFQGLLEITPGDPGLLVRLGACEYQGGDFEAAASSFRTALETQPDNGRALAGLGMSLNALERPAKARPVLERAVAQAPSDRMARLALAHTLTELGEFLRADELLRRLTEEEPGDWEAWSFLARLRFRNSYHEQALEALDRCLTLRPDDGATRILRARSLVKLDRLPEAEQVFRELSANPEVAEDWEFLLGYAEYSFSAGDLDTALVKVDAALSRKAGSGMLHYWKARILHHDGDVAGAQVEAERAVALSPDLREPRGLLVRIYQVQGMKTEAAEQVEWLRSRERAVAQGQQR